MKLNYFQQLKKIFKNSENEGTKLEKLFGNNAAINRLAQFYSKDADTISLIIAKKLYDFSTERVYTERDLVMYREGLMEFGSFLEECHTEYELKRIDAATE